MPIEQFTKYIASATAVFAMIAGGNTVLDKMGSSLKDERILIWSPEYFSISSGTSTDTFEVVVARQKLRDDCAVEDFKLEVKDSRYIVHIVSPSITKFSGPATPTVEKFGYTFTINDPQNVSKGKAILLAHIYYKCPEGTVLVNYPSHENLTFTIK